MVEQRTIVILLISIYGLSSVVLYLMIVVHFRLWMDGARVAFLILFQAGGTVIFFLFRPLPANCHNIGPETTCKTVEDIVIFGGWSLSGLLLIYALLLGIMSYIPAPAPLPNPEDALALNLDNKKRDSLLSVSSQYSQSSSFFGPAAPAAIDNNREFPMANSGRMGFNYHRPKTPASTRSVAPSTLYPTYVTRAPSVTRPSETGYNYYYRPHAPSLAPSSLTPGVHGQNTSQPLTYGSNVAAPPLVQLFPTPIPLQSAPPGILPSHHGSGHMPSRSRSVPSAPRSPSPRNLSFNTPIPAVPMSTVLRIANEPWGA
jgi:hypothetical protein